MNHSQKLVGAWAGGRGQGLSQVTAKIEAHKYQKKYQDCIAVVEEAGWKLPNGSPTYRVGVYTQSQEE